MSGRDEGCFVHCESEAAIGARADSSQMETDGRAVAVTAETEADAVADAAAAVASKRLLPAAMMGSCVPTTQASQAVFPLQMTSAAAAHAWKWSVRRQVAQHDCCL